MLTLDTIPPTRLSYPHKIKHTEQGTGTMSNLRASEIRPHVISTLRHNGYNPDMYNIAGIIRDAYGPKVPGDYPYSGLISGDFGEVVRQNRRKNWAQCSYVGCSNDALRWDVNPMCAEHADEEGVSADKLLTLLQEHIDSGTVEFAEVLTMFPSNDIDYPGIFAEGIDQGVITEDHLAEAANGMDMVLVDIHSEIDLQKSLDAATHAVENHHYASNHAGPFKFCYEDLCRSVLQA